MVATANLLVRSGPKFRLVICLPPLVPQAARAPLLGLLAGITTRAVLAAPARARGTTTNHQHPLDLDITINRLRPRATTGEAIQASRPMPSNSLVLGQPLAIGRHSSSHNISNPLRRDMALGRVTDHHSLSTANPSNHLRAAILVNKAGADSTTEDTGRGLTPGPKHIVS